jgi:ribosomal protein L22
MSAEEETTAPEPEDRAGEEQARESAAEKAPAAKKPDAKAKAPAEKATDEKKPAAKKGLRRKKPAEAKEPTAEQPAGKAPDSGKEPDSAKQAPAKRAPAKEPAAAKAPAPAKAPAEPKKGLALRKAQDSKKAPRRRVVRAHARYVRTSARKARMVCGHLRGKSVQEARAILAFTPRDVARDWSKLLESAVANAESNHELLEDDLIVREAYADEGPTIKRFRPRAMGRATPIRKRTSHLTIALTSGSPARTTKKQS